MQRRKRSAEADVCGEVRDAIVFGPHLQVKGISVEKRGKMRETVHRLGGASMRNDGA
jgi:hypothetical protein